MRPNRLEGILHLVFWSLFVVTKILIVSYGGAIRIQWGSLSFWDISYLSVSAVVFYINYLVLLPRFTNKSSLTGYVLSIMLSYLLFVLIRFLFEEKIVLAIWGFKNYYGTPSLLFYLKDNLYFSAPSIVFSTTIWSITNNMRLLKENAAIKIQRSEAELKFLKARVNPHFIFNSLNNIYSLVYHQKQQESLQAIESLAGMMRFTTYESEKECIPLRVEVEYIKDFMLLEKLRYGKELAVVFNVHILNNDQRMSPFILSPFIENAFKHGVVDDIKNPVTINLNTTSEEILFSVENKISTGKKDSLGGFGLENVRKRLAIYYPGRHKLVVEQGNGSHKILLNVKLFA
ncbi:sensor histidine kinase [Niabella yanshanensis]|uniref:Sensor histidine kinase n=1 Tax=Niabella yanshanensis TaxID=577386 RepID=A0ABZ0W561_9BACT|nr:sensor histidine kinase [Niabella yanshanensis]WQD36647.1 sensor histidine kinase [Niabella yanshanensis]